MPSFFRSIWILGIQGEERWEYWKLLAWTVMNCPSHFSWAVKMAVIMHHCRRVWQDIASKPAARPLQLVDNHLVVEPEAPIALTVSAPSGAMAEAKTG